MDEQQFAERVLSRWNTAFSDGAEEAQFLRLMLDRLKKLEGKNGNV